MTGEMFLEKDFTVDYHAGQNPVRGNYLLILLVSGLHSGREEGLKLRGGPVALGAYIDP
jgi:hypothetical protein